MVENNMSLYATGGTITDVSNKRIHTFTTAGTDTFTVYRSLSAEVLIVAGGGGGGQSGNPNEGAAGGGAGGLVYVSSTTLSAGSYTITVGAGGGVGSAGGNNNGINGGNSSFSTIYIGLGGGGGGAHDLNGSSGGSGGGAGGTNVATSPGSATQPGSGGFGNAGGGNYTGPNYAGGGGGGAGAAGGPAIATVAPASGGGTGGIGLAYSISGTTTYYAGGGGGGDKQTNSAAGGLGGGGTGGKASAVGQPGTPNTGGGGGGAASSGIGAGIGGSGIVIISYTVASVSFISLSSTQATVAVSPGTAIPGALYRIIAYNPEGAASNPVTFSITNSLSGSGPAFLNPGPQTFVGGGSFVINQTAASSGITWTRSPTTGVTLINPLDSGVNVTVSSGIAIASPTSYTITATDSAAQATSQTFTIQNTFIAPAFVNPGAQSFTNGGSFSVTQTAANTGQLGWSISPTTGMTLSSASTSGVTVTVSAGQAISGVTYALTAVNPTPTSCVQSFSVTNAVGPPPPTNVSASATGQTTATVTFTASAGATSYVGGGGGTHSISGTTDTITGLISNTPYTFTIYAVNASGTPSTIVSANQITTFSTAVALNIGTNAGVVTTFAGTYNVGGQTNGTGTGARFNYPRDILHDGAGNLYVSSLDGGTTLRKIVISTAVVTTISSSVSGIFGITYDGAGVIYYVNFSSSSIRKYVLSTNVDTLVAGGINGYLDGTGAGAYFSNPRFLCYYAGNLYVSDTDNSRIRKVTLAGVVTTLAGSGADASTDGTGTGASFSQPRGIVPDGSGNLYVVEERTFKIRKIVISTAVCTTFAGSTNGLLDGVGTGARFAYMNNIAIDPTNSYLYVADTNNAAIRKIIISSAAVSTIAGTNSSGYVDGTGTVARFNTPFGICTAGGALYICDAQNQLIRKIT